MTLLPKKILNHWELLTVSMKIYKQTWVETWWLTFMAAFFFTLPAGFFFPANLGIIKLLSFWQGWLAYFPFVFLGIICQLVIIQKIYCYAIGSSITTRLGFLIAIRKVPDLLLLAMHYFVIVLAGMVLLVIPGIIFSMTLIFSFFLVLLENVSVSKGISESHKLVWGNWWYTFYFISFLMIITLSFSLSFFLITEYIIHLIPVLNEYKKILLVFSQIFAQSFVLPFIFAFILTILENLKLKYLYKI